MSKNWGLYYAAAAILGVAAMALLAAMDILDYMYSWLVPAVLVGLVFLWRAMSKEDVDSMGSAPMEEEAAMDQGEDMMQNSMQQEGDSMQEESMEQKQDMAQEGMANQSMQAQQADEDEQNQEA